MPLYNFQKLFAAAVKSGTKRRTLRNFRKRPTNVGDILYLYSGLRTKHVEKLGVFICTGTSTITVSKNRIVQSNEVSTVHGNIISFPGNCLYRHKDVLDDFAQSDGFADFETMKRWITKVHGSIPWKCEMIEW